MFREMCKSKIHRATVTGIKPDYPGSIQIDSAIMREADILNYEKVLVVDNDNGSRFETYAIPAKAGSGEITVLGGAAKLVKKNHKVIIMAFALIEEKKCRGHKIKLVLVDGRNRIKND